MSLTSRKMMLVPLPLTLQHFLKFTSDHVPTLTLLTFVLFQFVLNILHYIPAKYWQSWVDRTRHVLKTLLDREFRMERYQIELLRQKLAEYDRRNTTTAQEFELSQDTVRSLRERIIKQSNECEAHKGFYETEVARLTRQLDTQGKRLAETEALLEAMRARESTQLSGLTSEEKNAYAEKVKHLEEQIATMTKGRRETIEGIQKLQSEYKVVQDQASKTMHANAQLQAEKEALVKQLEAMDAMERRLTESRNEALTRLNQALQDSAAATSAFNHQIGELQRQVENSAAAKKEVEQRLQEKDLALAAAQSQHNESPDTYRHLQDRVNVLEDQSSALEKQAMQAQLDHTQAVAEAQARVAELEAALAEKLRTNEELVQSISGKDEEIARLSEIVELGDLRPHKLRKPRASAPLTPPATLSRDRSNSLSSRLGFDRERQRTVSFGSHKAHPSPNAASGGPALSPSHRTDKMFLLNESRSGSISDSVAGAQDPTEAMDASIASIGSTSGHTPPSLRKLAKKKSASHGTRARLSSILGIYGGDKEKATNEETTKAKD